jgi:hypothetical protein
MPLPLPNARARRRPRCPPLSQLENPDIARAGSKLQVQVDIGNSLLSARTARCCPASLWHDSVASVGGGVDGRGVNGLGA